MGNIELGSVVGEVVDDKLLILVIGRWWQSRLFSGNDNGAGHDGDNDYVC